MKSSYKIAKIFNISVELHITFIFFFLFIFLLYWAEGGFMSGVGVLVLFSLIFFIVLLHELTHSFVAIKNGVKVPKITLLPIGGLASVEIPQNPEKELIISIAGPLLNFLIAIIAVILLVFIAPDNYFEIFLNSIKEMWDDIPGVIFSTTGILSVLIWINLMLGIFNILPGFPMDGGRVFRDILALWMDYLKATEIAVRVGQGIFIIMMLYGLFANFWLFIIGLFLFMGGSSELNIVKLRKSMENLKIETIAIKKFAFANENTSLSEFLSKIAVPEQRRYPVIDSTGMILGYIDLYELENIKGKGTTSTIKEFMKSFSVIDGSLKVEDKITELLSRDFTLVISEKKSIKKVVGFLTPDYVTEFARYYGISHSI